MTWALCIIAAILIGAAWVGLHQMMAERRYRDAVRSKIALAFGRPKATVIMSDRSVLHLVEALRMGECRIELAAEKVIDFAKMKGVV